MREVALDTETTGLDPDTGDRIVEIACVELINHQPTENYFHKYINPMRDMPEEAARIHGLTGEFLADKPLFDEIVEDFLTFVGDAPLVAHNAGFDMKFINAELKRCGRPAIPWERAVDTLKIAQERFPGARNSLDALCQRFGIDNTQRTLHGALLDTRLLAEVYLELNGGREPGLVFAAEEANSGPQAAIVVDRPFREPRPHAASAEEMAAFEAFLDKIPDPIWRRN